MGIVQTLDRGKRQIREQGRRRRASKRGKRKERERQERGEEVGKKE